MQDEAATGDGDPRALLRALQDPARYRAFLDTDDPREPDRTASSDASPDRRRDLTGVAAQLAAALQLRAEPDGRSDDEAEARHEPEDDAEALAEAPDGPAPRTPSDHRGRHPVLRAPITTGAHYLQHSADLTLTGGLDTALAAAPAVCALAEQYALRRVGGSSAASVSAACSAAAELGRTAPPSAPEREDAVPPGFAGLAGMISWLVDDRPTDRWRLPRLFQPDRTARDLHRLLIAALGPPLEGGRMSRIARTRRIVAACLATLDRAAWTVVGLLWLGAVAGWLGTVTALARSAHVAAVLVPVAAVPLAITFALAAAFGTGLLVAHATRTTMLRAVDDDGFGLVGGAAAEGPPAASRRLDRMAGVLPGSDAPPVIEWIADRLDDLAGVPSAAGESQRYALTFGELWLGRMGSRASADLSLLRRAAVHPRRRVVDLVLVTTDLSAGRPRLLPFGTAERPEQAAGGSFLFCPRCLAGLVPDRVIGQMVLMSPGAGVRACCPRHEGVALHDLPEPWDLPVVFAVRLAAATPGLLRPVPLYAPELEADDTVRRHWFGDGLLTGGFPMRLFDQPLPRWPTFTLRASTATADDVCAALQDSAPSRDRWRPMRGLHGQISATLAAIVGWRDALAAQAPAQRGRIGVVRGTGLTAPYLAAAEIARLALRGHRAGCLLRERFTSPDGEDGRTQTDRFRWIRLRAALAEYRQQSLAIGASLPLYSDLATHYRVPLELCDWFSPPLTVGHADPAWGDVVSAVTHLRSLTEDGVLDWDADWGAPPADPHLRLG